jgi:hypothetical protein
MKDKKVLDIKKKIMDKALQEWALSVQNMSPEDICIRLEEIKENPKSEDDSEE